VYAWELAMPEIVGGDVEKKVGWWSSLAVIEPGDHKMYILSKTKSRTDDVGVKN
jgi:hypothetical protein